MKPSLLMIVFLTGTVRSESIANIFEEFFDKGDGRSEENANLLEEKEENSNSVENFDDRYNEKYQWWKPKDGGGFEENNEIWVVEDSDDKENEDENTDKDLDNRVGWRYKNPHDPRTEEGYRQYMKNLEKYLQKLANQDHGYGVGGVRPSITQDLLFGHEELK